MRPYGEQHTVQDHRKPLTAEEKFLQSLSVYTENLYLEIFKFFLKTNFLNLAPKIKRTIQVCFDFSSFNLRASQCRRRAQLITKTKFDHSPLITSQAHSYDPEITSTFVSSTSPVQTNPMIQARLITKTSPSEVLAFD